MWEPTPRTRVCFSTALVPAPPALWVRSLLAGWVVLCCAPSPATQCAGSGVCWEENWCRPRSAVSFANTTWLELQSDLQTVTTFSGLGGAWKRSRCQVRLLPPGSGFRLLSEWQRAGQMRDSLLVSVSFWESWGTFQCELRQTAARTSAGRGLSEPTGWVGWGLRESWGWGGGQEVLARVIETQIWCPLVPAGGVWGGLSKGRMTPANCPSSPFPAAFLPLSQTIPFSPFCPWCFLSSCPSAGAQPKLAHQWLHLCTGPLRGMPGTPAASNPAASSLATFPAGFPS